MPLTWEISGTTTTQADQFGFNNTLWRDEFTDGYRVKATVTWATQDVDDVEAGTIGSCVELLNHYGNQMGPDNDVPYPAICHLIRVSNNTAYPFDYAQTLLLNYAQWNNGSVFSTPNRPGTKLENHY